MKKIDKKYYETKFYQIVSENTDCRLAPGVLSVVFEYGIDGLKGITLEEIESKSSELERSLLKAAVEVAKECNSKDLIEFIKSFY